MKFRRASAALATTLAAASVLLAAACASRSPSPLRVTSYAHPVPPGVTFDLAQGRQATPERLNELLTRTRLLFVGEHHAEPRSHAYQLEILKLLKARGREVTVALEMFPPSANKALEAWRRGRIQDEAAFLERSGWYTGWGFPWAYYRELFQWIRRQRLPLVGINVEKETRAAARKDDLSALPEALRNEIGPLLPSPEAQGVYLLDTLRGGGHGDELDGQSPRFLAYRRVQWLWDRMMGLRAAKLAGGPGGKGIVVVLLGSGHLAHKLGANLQTARVSPVPQLTIWDDVRAKSPDGRYAVPLGMADLVRVYEQPPPGQQAGWPSMAGIALEAGAAGKTGAARENVQPVTVNSVTVKSVRRPPGSPWHALKAGDVITALNGRPVNGPAHLRLAFENLKIGSKAQFEISREGKAITVEIPVAKPEWF